MKENPNPETAIRQTEATESEKEFSDTSVSHSTSVVNSEFPEIDKTRLQRDLLRRRLLLSRVSLIR